MARKKLNMITLHSWQECDEALRTIGEHQRDIAALESVINEQIANAKTIAADRAAPLKAQVAELELALRDYAQTHRDDMDGRKSKLLTFGSVGFRRSTRITLPSAKEKLAAIVARLRAKGMTDCITQPDPKVDKDALKKYGAEQVAEVGATLIVEDVFGYDVNVERLKD